MVATFVTQDFHTEAVPARPVPLSVLPNSVPEELKFRPIWLCWTYEWKGGRWTKVPLNPKTCLDRYAELREKRGDATDPRTWAAFDVAWEAYRKCGLDGIGITLDRVPLTLYSKTEVLRGDESRRAVTFETPQAGECFQAAYKKQPADVGGTHVGIPFLTLYSRYQRLSEAAQWNEAVARCDADQNGVISTAETEVWSSVVKK